MPRVGIRGQSYLNGGNGAVVQWIRAKIIHDLTIATSSTEVSIKNKGSNYEKFLLGLKSAPIDFDADWEPEDPVFQLMETAHLTDTPIEFLSLDHLLTTKGARGFRGKFLVTKFERSEPLDDEMIVSVSLRLDANSDDPAHVVVGDDGLENVVESEE